MMTFSSIIKDIRDIKIQGAQNIAIAAVKALSLVTEKHKKAKKDQLIKNITRAKKILFSARPTEPLLRNSLNYITSTLESSPDPYSDLKDNIIKINARFDDVRQKISLYGSKKILNKSIVFTHCHSSNVMNILFLAKKQKKRFHVFNTETRPLFQGRITAKDLSKKGIPVTHFIDSAAKIALKKADIMLIGADAISSEGKVINKIGSEMFSIIADKYDVPVYVCTDSWKFNPLTILGEEEQIEKRSYLEVWPKKPKGVQITNFAFENIDSENITGIISELGVFKPGIFVEEVKANYPWITKL